MKNLPWIVVVAFLLMSCGLSTPTPVPPPADTAVSPATATEPPTALPTDSPTPLPSETETPLAATIPPLLTSIPGIAATLTAVAATPGAENTLVAQQTMMAATQAVQLNGLSSSLLKQCPNPSDPPMQNWVDIPVMPQATAGQVVQTLIGSYYCFRAPVTVGEMENYYKEKLPPPVWVLQSDANGSMEFIGISLTGFQLLFLVSGPGNKNDLIVAINVTKPMNIPTPKP